jgi:hypothetical protein
MGATSMGVTLSISKTCTNSIGEQKYFRKLRTIIRAVKEARGYFDENPSGGGW